MKRLVFTALPKADANTGEILTPIRIRPWRGLMSRLRDLNGEMLRAGRRTEAVVIGSRVCIQPSFRSPLPGSVGIVIEVSMSDSRGPYLVEFADGLRFRYHASEFRRV